MAEKATPVSKENPVYVQYQGVPTRVEDPDQLEAMTRGGAKAIPKAAAQEGYGAIQDIVKSHETYGTAGEAALGAFSGLTLGLGPGFLGEAGIIDKNLAGAAGETGAYLAGDIAGTLAPAFFTGGESVAARGLLGGALRATPTGLAYRLGGAAERFAGGLLPEAAGLMGRAGSVPLKMAARGATEGALQNVGRYVGDSLIQNHALSVESMASAGIDGALFGGILGGGLGTVGSLGSMAVGKAAGTAGRLGGEALQDLKLGAVAKRLGMTEEQVVAARASGSLKETLKAYRGVLDSTETGTTFGSKTARVQEAAGQGQKLAESIRASVIETLEKEAATGVNGLQERLLSRLENEIMAPYRGTMLETEASSITGSFRKRLLNEGPKPGAPPGGPTELKPPKEPKRKSKNEWAYKEDGQWKVGSRAEAYESWRDARAAWKKAVQDQRAAPEVTSEGAREVSTWKGFSDSRDALALEAKSATGLKQKLTKELLAAVDAELRGAMEGAEGLIGQKGLADKYAAATLQAATARELEATVGHKMAQEILSTEPTITMRDVGVLTASVALGHPLAAMSWMAAKGVGRMLPRRLEPWMAESMYQSSLGVRAATAEKMAKGRIQNAVGNFFKSAPKAGYVASPKPKSKEPKGYSREDFEAAATRTEQLVSQNHQNKIREIAGSFEQQGYPQLGQSLVDTNLRASQYMLHNLPPRKGTLGLGSLRPQPKVHGLDLKEFKFLRIDNAVKDPFSVLDKIQDGGVSRDEMKAIKHVYPELHSQVVETTTEYIYQLKQDGKFLPMDKIVSLGIMLDYPVDSTLTPEFIGAVQSSFKQAQQEQGPQGPPPPQPPMAMGVSPENQQLLSPVDQGLV